MIFQIDPPKSEFTLLLAIRRLFQPFQQLQGIISGNSTDIGSCVKTAAYGRSFRSGKQFTVISHVQLHASDTCRLASRHPRDRRTDRGGNAAGAASTTTLHGQAPITISKLHSRLAISFLYNSCTGSSKSAGFKPLS